MLGIKKKVEAASNEGMECAVFSSTEQAVKWRQPRGGWLFVCDDGVAIWFALPLTVTQIMLHPATRGLSGKLV